MSGEPLVSAEEVASVLSSGEPEAAGPAGDGSGDPTVYSLRSPLALTPAAEPQARKRAESFCAALGQALKRGVDADVALEVEGFRQQQVRGALAGVPAPVWVLSLASDRGGLALLLEPSCALILIELALGGTGNSQATGRGPTPLESRVFVKLARTLAAPMAEACGVGFSAGEFRVGSVPGTVGAPGETVGAALLKVRCGSIERSGLLLASAALLRDGEARAEPASGPPGPIAARLERVPVAFRPVLDGGPVALRDLTALEPGKVLRLEAGVHSVLELRSEGLALFHGRVRKQEGGAGSVFEAVRRRGVPAGALAPRRAGGPAAREEKKK